MGLIGVEGEIPVVLSEYIGISMILAYECSLLSTYLAGFDPFHGTAPVQPFRLAEISAQ